jgi:hypothetical protein
MWEHQGRQATAGGFAGRCRSRDRAAAVSRRLHRSGSPVPENRVSCFGVMPNLHERYRDAVHRPENVAFSEGK